VRRPPHQPSSTAKSNPKPPTLSELLRSDLRAEKPSNHPQARAPRRPVSEAWPGGSFPRDFPFGVEVSHGIAMALVVAEDFGDQIRLRAVGIFVSLVFVGAIDPEAEGPVHAELHLLLLFEASITIYVGDKN
jgi:hypothetical protein